jgi:DeoR/GlpR family transcriptional regulator of sugar metabolism
MLKLERQMQIIKMVQSQGSVNVKEMSRKFNVSMMTIRRDLEEIESKNIARRIHGGAILNMKSGEHNELPTLDRMNIMAEEKRLIAREASALIKPGEMIFLGSGTTTLFVARELAERKDITIVTNALTILNELATHGTMTLIGIGGFLRRSEFSMIGHFADEVIKDLHVDKVVIGMRGIHPRYGLTSDHPQELMTDRTILGISDNIVIVADHTKIGNVATSRTAHIDAAQMIITSRNAREDMITAIRDQGVEVILI